jgi:hypothetical protein
VTERSLPKRRESGSGLYVVRLYDGSDHLWMDVSAPLSWEDATALWNEKTRGGTQNTRYEDFDYYDVFPSDTKMLFSSESER